MARFKSSEGSRFHTLALLYACGAYGLGLAGILVDNGWINIASTVLLAHGMVIAAYLVHECGHNTIFTDNVDNARLGTLLTWLCGASYGRYEDIRYKHFRHHVDNDDVVWFDYEVFFRRHPLFYRLTITLEIFYIPAHDLLMHFIMIFSSFIIPERRSQRVRNVTVIVIRASLFGLLAWWSLRAALLYMLAYLLMMTLLRFMDSLQHDYPYHLSLFTEPYAEHRGDLAWEQEHTFSNVISFSWEWPNWLVLNFGYHNAHHARPTTPWYQLPKLHRELFGDDPSRVIPLWPQLLLFHRYRRYRIFHDAPGLAEVAGADFLDAARHARVTGGNAASFLTAL